MTFFGRQTWLPSGPAMLAQRTGAALVYRPAILGAQAACAKAHHFAHRATHIAIQGKTGFKRKGNVALAPFGKSGRVRRKIRSHLAGGTIARAGQPAAEIQPTRHITGRMAFTAMPQGTCEIGATIHCRVTCRGRLTACGTGRSEWGPWR